MVRYSDLMVFWAVCISWSALFLTVVSVYLYIGSRNRVQITGVASGFRFVKDFVFVWVLLGLLGLYIVSIDRRSSFIFASGNIIVELLLIVYTVKTRTSKGSDVEKGIAG